MGRKVKVNKILLIKGGFQDHFFMILGTFALGMHYFSFTKASFSSPGFQTLKPEEQNTELLEEK
jgi:hypothetical protein